MYWEDSVPCVKATVTANICILQMVQDMPVMCQIRMASLQMNA